MAVTARITGTKQALKNLKKIGETKLGRVKDAIGIVQTLVVNDAKMIVPWVTGNLRNSISQGSVVVTLTEISGEVSAGMKYAGLVEGTDRYTDGRRYTPKPYLGPSILKNQRNLNSYVKRALA